MASVALMLGLAAFGSTQAGATSSLARPAKTSNPLHLIRPGYLVVGMNLVDKPEMYINTKGQPAGYDVVLIKALAKALGLKLAIENLAWTGLIPGLEAHKFDIVSVGLDNTATRRKVISFSQPYVPYEVELAVPIKSTLPATVAAWNQPGIIITAQLGTIDQMAAETTFPKATVSAYATDPEALLEVATGRANGAIVETYLIKAFQIANPNEIKALYFPKNVLPVYYAAYAVQKGNNALISKVNHWICANNKPGGFMAKAYEGTEGTPFPPMPAC